MNAKWKKLGRQLFEKEKVSPFTMSSQKIHSIMLEVDSQV